MDNDSPSPWSQRGFCVDVDFYSKFFEKPLKDLKKGDDVR